MSPRGAIKLRRFANVVAQDPAPTLRNIGHRKIGSVHDESRTGLQRVSQPKVFAGMR